MSEIEKRKSEAAFFDEIHRRYFPSKSRDGSKSRSRSKSKERNTDLKISTSPERTRGRSMSNYASQKSIRMSNLQRMSSQDMKRQQSAKNFMRSSSAKKIPSRNKDRFNRTDYGTSGFLDHSTLLSRRKKLENSLKLLQDKSTNSKLYNTQDQRASSASKDQQFRISVIIKPESNNLSKQGSGSLFENCML